MIEIRGYIDESGIKRFAQWLDGLDAAAAARVTIALARLEQGNFSQVKALVSASLNARSTSAQVSASTLARMATAL